MLAQRSADIDLLLVAGGGRVVDAQAPPASRCGGGAGCASAGCPQPATEGAAASEVKYRRLRPSLSGSGAPAANSVKTPNSRTWT
jgi:hypothetical protein